eukprot:GILK01001465.1.p1 GENE.GILK01001465.1~~GILK01001465.1.p1  ORF type:complete len:420 (+),score=83.23 GILK01001465.1:82-1260(+)
MAEADYMEIDATASAAMLELGQKRFLLTLPDSLVPNKKAVMDELIAAIKANNMVPFYKSIAEQFGWKTDDALLQQMTAVNDEELAKIEAKITDAESNLGDVEIRDAKLAKAEFYRKTGDKDAAVEAFRLAFEKTVGIGQKMDIVFSVIRIGFLHSDIDLVKKNIDKAKSLLEEGGDWERRNRLKVYQGLMCLMVRNFVEAAKLFLDSIATFTSYELCSYNQFIFYTVLTSMVALDRVTIRQKVVHAPEILAVIRDIPNLKQFLESLFNCQYRNFSEAFVHIMDQVRRDRYFSPHTRYFVREMRIVAYSQFLESYKSVKVASMAQAFGVTPDFLDTELSQFIASGRLNCKIDKVGGVVESNRPDSRNALYQSTIKQGDLLLNRIQKLSRVIDL